MASGGIHETLTNMLQNRSGGNAGESREVEVRFGRIVDGLYVPGVEEETWDRVLERLGSYDHWSASSVEFSTHVHYGASIHAVETGATSSKRRIRDVAFTTGTAVTVKACESVERACTAPRRRLTETAVRAKHRHSFSYKDKVRFDCSLCVTGTVVASCVATPRCTYEVELEAISDEATAASIVMKVDDVIEMITGTRPTQYTRLQDP